MCEKRLKVSSRYKLNFEFLTRIGKYHDYDCDEHKARDHLKEVGLNLPLLMSRGKKGGGEMIVTTHVHKTGKGSDLQCQINFKDRNSPRVFIQQKQLQATQQTH